MLEDASGHGHKNCKYGDQVKSESFTKDDYRQLADYIITQQKRTPESRIKGTQLAKEVERQLRAKGASEDFIKEQGLESEKYDSQFQQIYGLLNSGVLQDIEDLCDRYWIFWSNKTKHNFYTSDHTVVGYLYQHSNHLLSGCAKCKQ